MSPLPLGVLGSSHKSGVNITDSFDRADSTTTLGSTDTGQAWTAHSGTWGITGNLAYNVASPTQATASVDAGVADCTVSVVVSGSPADYGLCFRVTDASNQFVTAESACYKKEGGSFTSLGSLSSNIASGDTVSVELSGTSIVVKKNGTTVLTASSSFNQTATRHGLRTNTANARFNNFSITA